jgi:hypothetical protein
LRDAAAKRAESEAEARAADRDRPCGRLDSGSPARTLARGAKPPIPETTEENALALDIDPVETAEELRADSEKDARTRS